MQLYFTYPGWKRKAVTFTYDDGMVFDRKMVEIFNRHNLKGTFNLTPSWLGDSRHVAQSELSSLYAGHEIASHGYRHLHLNRISQTELRAELRDGRAALEDILGKPVRGFASPYGEHGSVAMDAMREAGFAYARSTAFTGSYTMPFDWISWAPSAHHGQDVDTLIAPLVGNESWGGTLRLLNIMGHSYEFDRNDNWDLLENICKSVAGRDDIWYATNIEIHDYTEACRKVRVTMDGAIVENMSAIPLYANYGNGHGEIDTVRVKLMPGEVVNLRAPGNIVAEKNRVVEIAPGVEEYHGGRFTPAYPGWKMKALTFSYDDGCPGDRHLVEILNRFGMKGTFNLNSDGRSETIPDDVQRDDAGRPLCPITKSEWTTLFEGHEVAVHGAQHGTYNCVPYPCVVDDIYRNRIDLEKVLARPIRGMAYPCGYSAKNPQGDTVLKALGVVYSRVVGSTRAFDLPTDFMDWRPTAHHNEEIDEIADKFLAIENPVDLKLCYIWGHAFELDNKKNWNVVDDFCRKMANKDDIWYATNIDIYEYVSALRSLNWSLKGDAVENDSPITIFGYANGRPCVIRPSCPGK